MSTLIEKLTAQWEAFKFYYEKISRNTFIVEEMKWVIKKTKLAKKVKPVGREKGIIIQDLDEKGNEKLYIVMPYEDYVGQLKSMDRGQDYE